MTTPDRPLAVVTGASTGIGYELAKRSAENGFDLVVAADESEISAAAEQFRRSGSQVGAVETDLARIDLGAPKIFRDINRNTDRGAGTHQLNGVHHEFGDGNHAPDWSSAFRKSQQMRR